MEFGPTSMLNEQGNLCCLGHYCRQMGVPDKYMQRNGLPCTVALHGGYNIPDLVEWCGGDVYSTPLAIRAADINDDPSIRDDERERQLTALFAEDGIEVEFYDGYLPSPR